MHASRARIIDFGFTAKYTLFLGHLDPTNSLLYCTNDEIRADVTQGMPAKSKSLVLMLLRFGQAVDIMWRYYWAPSLVRV